MASKEIQRDDRRYAAWLFGISAAAALLMRILYLLQVREATLFKAPLRDSAFYVARAWEILNGDPVGKSVSFHSAPLYPYFIALVMAIGGSGDGLWWLRLAQAMISALGAGLLALTALRLFGRWAGVATAMLAVFYGPFLFYSGEILEITLTMAFMAWAFWLLARDTEPGGGRLFAVGALLGLAALGKPNLLILGPALWISFGFFRTWKRPSAWAWRQGLLLAAGFLVAILPFTLRNKLAGDDWVLISSNGGINLFIGNNPQADGAFYVPSSMATDLEGGSRQVAEETRGKALKPSEVSRFWSGRALAFFTKRPGEAAILLARKAALMFNHYEIPNHYNYYFFREYYAPILRWPLVSWSMLMPLGILGLVLGARRHARSTRMALSLLAVALSVVAFFVTSRYRLPVVVLLFPFAGLGVVALGRFLKERRWRPLIAALAILVAASALAHIPMTAGTGFHHEFLALSDFWFQQKDYKRAAFYSTEALRHNMKSAPAWHNLGYAYLEQGDFVRAEDCLWKSIDLDPSFGYAYANLAKLYFDYSRPILAQKCLDKAEVLAPMLKTQLAEIRKNMPLISNRWEERAMSLLRDLDKKVMEQPDRPQNFSDRAQILGLRLELHDEALARLDSIPQAALRADSSFAGYVRFMRSRLEVARDHMRYLD